MHVIGTERANQSAFSKVTAVCSLNPGTVFRSTCAQFNKRRLQKEQTAPSRLFHVLHPCVGFQLFEPGTQRSSKSERRRISVLAKTIYDAFSTVGFEKPGSAIRGRARAHNTKPNSTWFHKFLLQAI